MADRTHSHDTSTPAMSAETVPSEEFVLVPREPTHEMLNAAPASYSPSFKTIWPLVCGDIYRAMIAAAPTLSASHLAKEGGEAGAMEAEVERLSKVYAEATGYYVPFHAGLHSESSNRISTGIKAVLAAAPQPSPALAKSDDAVREALVKPLEWRRFDRDREFAQTPFGRWLTDSVSGFVTVEFRGVIEGEPHPTVEAAKAFAQADYDRRIRAALSTPTEGPASQTEGMGRDRVWLDRRVAHRHAVELEQCSIFAADVGDAIAKSMTDAAADLRAALTAPETAEAVPIASDPAPATDDRERLVEALKSAAVSLEQAAGRFNLMGGVGLVNGADPKAGYAEAYEASCVARAALATEASR